jgi:hypothetical protein
MSARRRPGGRLIVLAVLSAAAFAYAAVRAVRIPIVHDEALTFFFFVSGPWAGTLDPKVPLPENNHFLNSVLSAVSWKVFGGGDLALRIPNLLSYLLFLAATASLALRQSTASLTVAAFLLLNAQAFAVEFFSLSRGYGLGLAFLAAGIALLVTALERPARPVIPASLGVLSLGLAALAHLSFLLPLASCVTAGLAREAWRLFRRTRRPGREDPEPSLLVPLGVALPFLLVLVPYAVQLSRARRFFMGGVRGLWSDTVLSLLAVLRERLPADAPRAPLLEVAVAAALLFVAAALLLRPRLLAPVALVPAVLLGLSAAGYEFACRIFGARYPIERAALPLQFLFLAAAAGAGGEWIARRRAGWRIVRAAVFVAAAGASAAFLSAAGTTHTLLWRYDADGPRALADLDRARRERAIDRPVRLGITWLLEPSINYYRVRKKLGWLLPVDRSGLAGGKADFFYFTPQDEPVARSLGAAPLEVYPASGNCLAARGQARAGTSAPTGVNHP